MVERTMAGPRRSKRTIPIGARLATLLALLCLSVGASLSCSDEDSPSGSPSPSAQASPAVTATPPGDPVVNALLTLKDLAFVWVVDRDGKAASTGFCLKPETDATVAPKRTAQRSFKLKDSGPFLSEAIRAYEGDGARQAMDALRSLVASCTRFTRVGQDAVKLDYVVTPVSVTGPGDEAIALTMAASGVPGVGSIQVNYLFWRRGTVLVQLDWTSVGAASGYPPELASLGETADAAMKTAGLVP